MQPSDSGTDRTKLRSRFCQLVLAVVMLALAALVGRSAYLQLSPATAKWRTQAQRQQSQVVLLPARRGSILDRTRRRVLAGDVRAWGVFADPKIITDAAQAARELTKIVGIDAENLRAKIEAAGQRRFVWLKRDIDEALVKKVQRLRIRGIAVKGYQRREYPQGKLAGQLLGFVGADGVGLEGIERQFDAELSGRVGYLRRIADPGRRALSAGDADYKGMRDGANVVLTIDSAIQQITEKELGKACEQFQAKWGIAIVMDPANGEVLAMASWPGFSPQEFAGSNSEHRRNRCVSDVYEPGSTFKSFVAGKALEAGLFELDEKIFCHNGAYVTGGRTLHDHGAGYGELSFVDVVVHSSNIGMAIVGQRMGNPPLYRALRDFGFGDKTGIDLAGESRGMVADLDKWTSYSYTSVPMGHEIGVTGVQLIRAFCAIANGGTLHQVSIVREVVRDNGEVLWQSVADKQPTRVLDENVAKVMREQILAQVVERGTGRRAKIEAWRVFGKTGTSQVAGKGGYLPDKFVGSFVGGAPVQEPRICVLISIGEPIRSLGYYGGTVAAPAAGAIIEQTLGYLGQEQKSKIQSKIQK